MKKISKISILSPAHQNQGHIKEFVESVFKDVVEPLKRKGIKNEVVVAEDGSTDNTRPILQSLQKKYKLKLLLASKKLGPVKAIKNLFKAATGDLIFFLDADGEVKPKSFWRLFKVLKEKDYDVVVGFKIKRKPFYRFIISRIDNLLLKILFNTKIRDANAGCRLYKGEVGKKIVANCGFLKYNFNSEQIILATKRGYKIGEVGVPHFAQSSMVFKPHKLFLLLFFAFWELFKFRIYLFGKDIWPK